MMVIDFHQEVDGLFDFSVVAGVLGDYFLLQLAEVRAGQVVLVQLEDVGEDAVGGRGCTDVVLVQDLDDVSVGLLGLGSGSL
jgi:hypothetical protein